MEMPRRISYGDISGRRGKRCDSFCRRQNDAVVSIFKVSSVRTY